MKRSLTPQTALVPVPAVLISCGDYKKANITTVAWTGVLNSEPPLVYISLRPTRFSYGIIKEREEFVINIPQENLVWQVDFCGTKSGKETDKFEQAKLTKEDSRWVNCPGIKECPIQLECRVKEIKKLGSHDMFIAQIINTNVEKELLTLEGNIDYANLKLLTYAGSNYYAADKVIAKRGICLT